MTRARRYRSDAEYLDGMRRMIKAASARLDNCEIEQLVELIAMQRQLDQLVKRTARALHDNGATWTELAMATGTSKQAAAVKWGGSYVSEPG